MVWSLFTLFYMVTTITALEPLYSRVETDYTGTQQRQGPGKLMFFVNYKVVGRKL